MLKLNESEYNLDNIFGLNFDLLKEILIKLAKNDNKTIKDINDIKYSNLLRDQRILDLEQKITELNNIMKIPNKIKQEKKLELTFDSMYNNEIQINNSEKKPGINKDTISIKKIDDFILTNEELKQLEKNHAYTESLPTKTEIIIIKDNDTTIKQEESTEKDNTKKNPNNITLYFNKKKPLSKKKYDTDINLINISDNLLSTNKKNKNEKENPIKMNKKNVDISNLNDHINFVEKSLLLKNAETLKIFKDLLSDHNIQSMSKFNSLTDQIKNLTSKKDQIEKTLNLLVEKIGGNTSINFDKNNGLKSEIIQIYNDDENKEDKKLMPKTFMDSINKRFELNNNRYMKAYEESHKMKQNISNIFGMLDNNQRQMDLLKNDIEKNNEEVNKIKTQLNELIEIRNKEINYEENIPLETLKDINNYIDKKMNELLDYLLQDNNNDDNNKNNENNNQDQSNKKEKALMKLINKKITQLDEKMDLIEEESKLQKKSFNIKYKEMDNEFKKINDELNGLILLKLEQKDLDELYNKNLKNTDEVNKMRLKLDEIFIAQEKIRNDTPNFIKRLESLTNDMSEIKDNFFNQKGDYTVIKKEYNTNIEENGNEINEEDKLQNIMSPITEEIQKLIMEIENINMKIKHIMDQNKLFPKKKFVEKLESNLYDKINTLENNVLINYLKKNDFHKMVKTFDIQIKHLQENNTNNNNSNQKQESENWILAKQPIKCFNCASCEANISSNSLQQNDPIAWNKIHGQYRIGQGFSKLLKKLDSEINKDKDLNITEKRNRLLNTSFENIEPNNNLLMVNNKIENIKMNSRISGLDEKHASLKKYKLPKLFGSFKRKQKSTDSIPVSDEEKEDKLDLEEGSPQIIKITKVKNDEIQNQNLFEVNNNQIKNKTGRNSANKASSINKTQSLPLN